MGGENSEKYSLNPVLEGRRSCLRDGTACRPGGQHCLHERKSGFHDRKFRLHDRKCRRHERENCLHGRMAFLHIPHGGGWRRGGSGVDPGASSALNVTFPHPFLTGESRANGGGFDKGGKKRSAVSDEREASIPSHLRTLAWCVPRGSEPLDLSGGAGG